MLGCTWTCTALGMCMVPESQYWDWSWVKLEQCMEIQTWLQLMCCATRVPRSLISGQRLEGQSAKSARDSGRGEGVGLESSSGEKTRGVGST